MTAGLIAWKKNLRLAALSGVVLLASMVGLSAPHLPSQLLQFVAEHGNIAAALVRGDGFADPFGTPSGPTAWTPPVFACYLAGVFAVFGIKTVTSAWVLLVLDAAFAGVCVLCTTSALDLCDRAPLKSWFAFSLVAVSYTHLDVYKRQALVSRLVQAWNHIPNRRQRLEALGSWRAPELDRVRVQAFADTIFRSPRPLSREHSVLDDLSAAHTI